MRITFRIMPESAAQVTALETGEVDLVWNLPLESIERFQKNANVTVDSVATSTWDGVIMNAAHKPFDDVRVRRAVALALDKKALVEAALYGHGSVTHTMISPTHPYYNKDIAIAGPDIAGAKKLLAEAGIPNGFKTTIFVPSGSAAARARRHHRQGAAEAGRHRRRCPARAVGQVRQGHRGQGGFLRRRLLQPADASIPRSIPGITARDRGTRCCGTTRTRPWTRCWTRRAPPSPTRSARKLYKEFQVLAVNEPAGVIPYVLNHVNAFRKNVKAFQSSPMMWLDLRQTTVQ